MDSQLTIPSNLPTQPIFDGPIAPQSTQPPIINAADVRVLYQQQILPFINEKTRMVFSQVIFVNTN